MPRRRPGVLLPVEIRILEAGSELQRTEGTFYGFAIARQLARNGEEPLMSQGALYKALNRMAAAGLLLAEWEDAAEAESQHRPRRRNYRLTADGARALAVQATGHGIRAAARGKAALA